MNDARHFTMRWNTTDRHQGLRHPQDTDQIKDIKEARALILGAIDGPSKEPFPEDLNQKLGT